MKDGIYGSCAAQGWNCPNQRKKQTNADRIRSMNNEELADFLDEVFNNISEFGFSCVSCNEKINCDVCFLEWLQSEVEE